MSPSDFSILSIWIIFGILFLFLGTDKLYKFYMGLIVGFLLYLVFNLKISLLEYLNPADFSAFENFLIWNKDFVLAFLTWLIPLLGFLFWVFSNPLSNNKLFSFILWLIAPVFALWILSYIASSSVIELWFLTDLMNSLSSSSIVWLFSWNSGFIFYLLLFLLFWRFIFLIWFAALEAFLQWLFSRENIDEDKKQDDEE